MPDQSFPGYAKYEPADPFEEFVGPFWFRKADGKAQCCMLPDQRHLNSGGMVHGGLLMSFADYALATAAGATAGKFALTVALTCQFLNAGRPGVPIEAEAEEIRAGKTLSFVRGQVSQEGSTLLACTGTFRPLERGTALARRIEPATLDPADREEPPPGFRLVERASPFLHHVGPSFVGERNGRRVIVQPTAPHMLNAGGLMHGGMLMNFADNALCTEIALATGGKAPITTTFTAEFLNAGRFGPLLESAVESLKISERSAFVRGLVLQAGATLLSYSALITLMDRKALRAPQG
ncbi:MAG: PaaI family thioesterase [Reyranellaceae bacterium]